MTMSPFQWEMHVTTVMYLYLEKMARWFRRRSIRRQASVQKVNYMPEVPLSLLDIMEMKKKTKEAFVQNPLNPNYPELIYKTGDLVKI